MEKSNPKSVRQRWATSPVASQQAATDFMFPVLSSHHECVIEEEEENDQHYRFSRLARGMYVPRPRT